jgi:hypothetical protein
MAIFSSAIFAIGAATLAGMVLGALWYSPLLFGHQWMRSLGKTTDTLGSQTRPMIGSVLANFLTALGLFLLFNLMSSVDLTMAITVGAIVGFLIIFPALLSDNLFCRWGTSLLFIQSGYRILTAILMSLFLFLLN